jgi:pyridoxine 4-dehydrogenase
MPTMDQSGTFALGDRVVSGWAMAPCSLPAPGPPKDRDAALAVLRAAVAQGVNHIDTSDYYGPPRHQPTDPRGVGSLS